MSKVKLPEPGIYEGVPFETYLSWGAMSNSRLKLAARSMAHYKAGFTGADSKSLRLGSLVHCGKLEPLEIAKRYAVMPAFENDPDNKTNAGVKSTSKSTGVYKRKKKEFVEANKDKTTVEPDEYDKMIGMVTSIAANDLATEVLGGKGPVEVSIVWKDPRTDMMCKARFDKLQLDKGRFADLKTTKDCKGFEKEIITYMYHRQAGFYQWGYEVLTGEVLEPWLVPVESSSPWLCRCAPLDEWLVQDGLRKSRETMVQLVIAIESNTFPGYENPNRWFAPAWYSRSDLVTPVEVQIGEQKVVL